MKNLKDQIEREDIGPTGLSVELEDADSGARGASKPRHDSDRKWPFALVHANNWDLIEVDGRPYLLPDLTRKIDRPGSNRVKQTASGAPNTDLRDVLDQRARRVLIPRSLFIRQTKERDTDGRPWHYSIEEEPRTYDDGQVLVRCNMSRWNAFRISLLTERVIRPPDDLVVDRMRRRLDADTQRASSHMPDARSVQKRERAALLLSQLDEAATNSRALYDGREAA